MTDLMFHDTRMKQVVMYKGTLTSKKKEKTRLIVCYQRFIEYELTKCCKIRVSDLVL